MSKLKSKKYKSKVQNPTGIPCEKDSELYLEHYSTSDAESIAEKLKSPCSEDREIGAMILANMASNQQLVTNLIDKKIIRVAAPLLIDKSPNVRHAIAGSLRLSEQRNQEQRNQIWSPISMAKAVEAMKEEKMHCKEATETFDVPEIVLLKLFEEKYGNAKVISPSNVTDPTVSKSKYEYKNEGNTKQLVVQEWSVHSMAGAIKAVKNEKISWKHAAKTFGVPRATLAKLLVEIFGNSGLKTKMDCLASIKSKRDKCEVEDSSVQLICSSLQIDRAIKAVKEENMGWKKAAKTFKVPKATLRRKLYENHAISSEESQGLLRPFLDSGIQVSDDQGSLGSLEKALKSVREEKIGWKKAAKIFGVPKATLKRSLYKKNISLEEPQANSCPQISSLALGDFDIKEKSEIGLIQRAWSPESMKKALEAVITKKHGLKKAAETFDVPKTTLRLLLYIKYSIPNETSQANISCPPIITPTIRGDFDAGINNLHSQVKQTWSPDFVKEMLETLEIKRSKIQKAAEALGVPKFILMSLLCQKCGIPKRASDELINDKNLKTVEFNMRDQCEQQETKLSESMENAIKAVKTLKMRWRDAAKLFGISKAALKISLCDKNSISRETSQVRVCCSEVLTLKQEENFKIKDDNTDQQGIEQSSSTTCMVQSVEAANWNELEQNKKIEKTEVQKRNLKRLLQDGDIIGDESSPAKTKCLSILNSDEKFKTQDRSEEQQFKTSTSNRIYNENCEKNL